MSDKKEPTTGLIGVVAGDAPLAAFVPKKDLLLFDKIAFAGLDRFIRRMSPINDSDGNLEGAEYEFLKQANYIFDPFAELGQRDLIGNQHYRAYRDQADAAMFKIEESMLALDSQKSDLRKMSDFAAAMRRVRYLESMAYTNYLIGAHRFDACCILDPDDLAVDDKLTKSSVAVMVLEAFPIPSEETPWENIIAFKNDPDAQERRLALRLWLSEIARGEYDINEVRDRIEYLLLAYENSMRLFEMKYQMGTLKTAIVSAAEILEGLVKLRFSQVTKALFSIRDSKVDLQEAERKATGRELSYISLAKKRFEGI